MSLNGSEIKKIESFEAGIRFSLEWNKQRIITSDQWIFNEDKIGTDLEEDVWFLIRSDYNMYKSFKIFPRSHWYVHDKTLFNLRYCWIRGEYKNTLLLPFYSEAHQQWGLTTIKADELDFIKLFLSLRPTINGLGATYDIHPSEDEEEDKKIIDRFFSKEGLKSLYYAHFHINDDMWSIASKYLTIKEKYMK